MPNCNQEYRAYYNITAKYCKKTQGHSEHKVD